MKKLITLALFCFSFTSFAAVCELEIKLSPEADKLILTMKDSETAGTDNDLAVRFMGGNPERKNCADLKRELAGRKLEAEIDGVMMPIVIEDVSACGLEAAKAAAIASLPESSSDIYGTKGKTVNNGYSFVLNYDAEGTRQLAMITVKADSCLIDQKTTTTLEALVVSGPEEDTASEPSEVLEADEDSIF